MEDYIVIILTIIILIVGAVGRNKKKIAQQSEFEEPHEPENNLWDIMEELGVQSPIPKTAENRINEIEIVEMSTENPYHSFSADEEGGSYIKDKILRNEMKIEKPENSEYPKKERFSLKKAIIYSEILNRKYI